MRFEVENNARVSRLCEANEAFTRAQFDEHNEGVPVMPSYSDAPFTVKADRYAHPRVLLTRNIVPDIMKNADGCESERATTVFLELLAARNDGRLPPATIRERGLYAINNRLLVTFQAKALGYLLSGNREYGYEAIIGIKNYLLTISIVWLRDDICRHFGYAMYVAACVYDWCYDLLTEDDKFEIICGVAYKLCSGETEGILKKGMTHKIDKKKMEMGFPPTLQNSVTGHGCEMQLMRDYMAFALAIYDDEPSWWNFIGARFYAEYPLVRDIYYEAGIYPQGTLYAPYRMLCDLWCAWLLKTAIGENPFREAMMRQVMPTLLSFETVNGAYFHMGDDTYHKGALLYDNYGFCALIASYLFNDCCMKAWAKQLAHGYTDFSAHDPHFHGAPNNITPSEFLILNSNGLQPHANRYQSFDLIQYNGGIFGNIIARNSRDDDAAIIMMRSAGRTTANHDHADAGTFQIYFKGLVTGDSGVYDGYGTPQHLYYHQATLAHNGVLVYNPEHGDFDCDAHPALYGYSGGQRRMRESGCLRNWLSDEYDTGFETGIEFGYYDAQKKQPRFIYSACDYTQSYPKDTVERITRDMLAIYTGQKDAPLILFVLDDVIATNASFRKAILLQCPAAPVIDYDNGLITVADEGGKLVCTTLLGTEKIEAYGGKERQFFNAKDGTPSHGVNICCVAEGSSSDVWGHVELVASKSDKETIFLNVIYVTDKSANPRVICNRVTDVDCEGMYAALGDKRYAFLKMSWNQTRLSIIGANRETEYFIGGVKAGIYAVRPNGKAPRAYTVTDKACMLNITADTDTIIEKIL